jgi:hypothetical protein
MIMCGEYLTSMICVIAVWEFSIEQNGLPFGVSIKIYPMNKGIGGHQSANSTTVEWLSPPEIIRALGPFDLDPCAPIVRPWPMAFEHYTVQDNGLLLPWHGRIWMNPPYGPPAVITPWMHKLSQHGNGVALIFARTETKMFFRYVWERADSIFFIQDRLYFYDIEGQRAKANGGAPSALVAYGTNNVDAIEDAGLKGKHVMLRSVPVMVIAISPSWKNVITIALTRLNGSGHVQQVYDMVERIAPDKIARNKNYKEKIRQKLQSCFTKMKRGYYAASSN